MIRKENNFFIATPAFIFKSYLLFLKYVFERKIGFLLEFLMFGKMRINNMS